MPVLKSSSILSSYHFHKFPLKPKSLIFLLCYSSYSPTTSASNSTLFNYLVKDLDFTETQALSIAKRYPNAKSIEKSQSVAKFFRNLGFSNSQIAACVRFLPQVLFAKVETNLGPKIKFFQDLGVAKPDLGKFFARNPALLACSLDKKLAPSFQFVKKVLRNNDNKDLIKVLKRSRGFIAKDCMLKLSRNIEYIESCGIVGRQLSKLLMRQPRIFRMRESALKNLVLRALHMWFSTNSRMLVYAIHCMSKQTLKKKWELLKSFGFWEKS